MRKLLTIAAAAILCAAGCTTSKDIVIIGGGASGCSASVAAARLGSSVLVVEELPWLGGMLTSAGVTAVDGNYNLRAGIFEEFEQKLADYYGGWDKLHTAWVSLVMFEPHVGEQMFEELVAAEPNIELRKETKYVSAQKLSKGWKVTVEDLKTGKQSTVKCKVLIDCTELGDVAKAVGVDYRLGFDSKADTGEWNAYDVPENIVQDLTVVATIKDYGPDADMTIPMPEGYRIEDYANCCINPHNIAPTRNENNWKTVKEMLTYGMLPNNKVMLNWPIAGNDIYLNVVEMTPEEREEALKVARNRALGYVYFIQTGLGLKNWGLADDEYGTEDGLAYIPYYRESRRIKGEAFYVLDAMERPYDFTFYRAGAAVGDYPVDHHHYAHPEWERLEQLYFYPVPSYSVPAGVTVPLGVEDMLVAEKSISVSNLANGATRLQPVVTQIGQVAGTIAAVAVRNGVSVREANVREVQTELLNASMYLQPFRDLPKSDPDFLVLQRIGSTGIMHGYGKPVGWANQTWFKTDEPARKCDLYLDEYYGIPHVDDETPMTRNALTEIIQGIKGQNSSCAGQCGSCGGCAESEDKVLTRLEAARIIDAELHPFESVDVDWAGRLLK